MTEADSSIQFGCDACGKQYTWEPQLAGRRVRCKCGQVVVVPSSPPEAEGPYDIAPEEPAMSPSSPPVTPALEYQRADVRATETDLYFPDRVKDLYIPLALIGAGTVIEVAMAFFGRRGGVDSAESAVLRVGIYMIINTVLMLVAIFAVAKLRDISFGPLPTAILKLCGISIGPGAIGSLAGFMLAWLPFGGIVGWILGFVLYFALIGALFDLDEPDTWWCVVTIFLTKVAFVIVVSCVLAS